MPAHTTRRDASDHLYRANRERSLRLRVGVEQAGEPRVGALDGKREGVLIELDLVLQRYVERP